MAPNGECASLSSICVVLMCVCLINLVGAIPVLPVNIWEKPCVSTPVVPVRLDSVRLLARPVNMQSRINVIVEAGLVRGARNGSNRDRLFECRANIISCPVMSSVILGLRLCVSRHSDKLTFVAILVEAQSLLLRMHK